MEKEKLLNKIEEKRKQGLDNSEIYHSLMSRASNFWSSEELASFVFQKPSSENMEKFELRNKRLSAMIIIAFLTKSALVGLRVLSLKEISGKGLFDHKIIFALTISLLIYGSITLFLWREIKSYKRKGYIFTGVVCLLELINTSGKLLEWLATSNKHYTFFSLLLFYGLILGSVLLLAKKSLDSFWPELNWKGQFKSNIES